MATARGILTVFDVADGEQPIIARVSPTVVALDANYQGVVDSGQSLTINVSVAQGPISYAYDSNTPFANNSYRINSIVQGNVSVTNNNDGTLSVTNITSDSQIVTFNVVVRDANGNDGTVNRSITVQRNSRTREMPEVRITPDSFILDANYLGQVTPVSETITASVIGVDGTAYAYDANDAGTAETFFITSIADGQASVTNNLNGTATLTDLADDADSESVVFNIRYYDNEAIEYNIQQVVRVTKNTATRLAPGVSIDRNLVSLEADYLGEVTSGQSEDVTITVDGFTYDAVGEIGNNGFRVSVNADGGASVTNNNDGSVSITNLPTNQATADVTLQVDYRDDAAELYSQTAVVTVSKNLGARPVLSSLLEPTAITFAAAADGTTASQPTTVNITVFEDNTAYTYTTVSTLTNGTYRIDSIATGGNLGVANNNNGTLTVNNPSNALDSSSYSIVIVYRDNEGTNYTRTLRGTWSKSLTGDGGDNAFTGGVTLSTSPTFVQTPTGWPTARSCVATATFTDGTTTVDEVYTVTVNASGVLSGVESSDDAAITSSINAIDDSISITWTHTSGATATQVFSSVALAPRTAEVDVYLIIPQATAPVTPTFTSYDFDTGAIVGLTTGWQVAPVTVEVTNTSNLYWTQKITVSEVVYDGAQTITPVGTPTASINFGNDIQSDNFVADTSGWQIARDTGDAEFSNITVRGNSTIDSSTIGGDAAVALTTLAIAQFTPSTDTTGASWVGELFRGGVPNSGSLTIDYERLLFTFIGSSVTATNLIGITYALTLTVTDESGAVTSTTSHTYTDNSVLSQSLITPSATTVNNIRADFSNIVTVDEGDEVSLTAVITRPTGQIWMFSLALVNTDMSFVLTSKPSNVSSYIVSSELDQFGAEILGGRGLRLPRLLLWSGSTTATVVITSDFTRSYGTNIVVVVEWDDTSTSNRGSGLPVFGLGGIGVVVLKAPTETEDSRSSPGTGNSIDFTKEVKTYDGRRVGSIITRYPNQLPTTGIGGFINFNTVTSEQDSSISNFRIVRISYEYTS